MNRPEGPVPSVGETETGAQEDGPYGRQRRHESLENGGPGRVYSGGGTLKDSEEVGFPDKDGDKGVSYNKDVVNVESNVTSHNSRIHDGEMFEKPVSFVQNCKSQKKTRNVLWKVLRIVRGLVTKRDVSRPYCRGVGRFTFNSLLTEIVRLTRPLSSAPSFPIKWWRSWTRDATVDWTQGLPI